MEFLSINFNKRILPIIASFVSGMTLGWMIGDNNAHKHFHKYHHIPIPQAPIHNFYAYARTADAGISSSIDTSVNGTADDFKNIQATLAETHNDVEKLYTQKQQSKVGTLQ